MTVLCAHSSSKYYALTPTFCFPPSVSVSPSLSPAIAGYRMPHVALSALVIDSRVRWQIDHYSGLGFSNCGSGPPPHHHHYSRWPIDLPGRGASGLGVPTKDSFFTSDTPPSLLVSLPPACGQLSRRRTIRLMFLRHAFMSDAMELCAAAEVARQMVKGTSVSARLSFAVPCGSLSCASHGLSEKVLNIRGVWGDGEIVLMVEVSRC